MEEKKSEKNSKSWLEKCGMLIFLIIGLAVWALIFVIGEYFPIIMRKWYDEGTIVTNLLSVAVPIGAGFYFMGFSGKLILYPLGIEAWLIMITVLYFSDSKFIPYIIISAVAIGLVAAYFLGLSIMKKDKMRREAAQKAKQAELESLARIRIMERYGKHTEITIQGSK